MSGVLSKGIELQVESASSTYTAIPGLQSIPDIMPSVDKVETTTLADAAKTYIPGLKDYGDLTFSFLYDNSGTDSSFRVCKGLEGSQKNYKVVFPDDTEFKFSGSMICGPKSVKTNDVVTFDAKITLSSDITVTNPA